MSSIPSSAMPHAKAHDDDHLAEHDTHEHDAPTADTSKTEAAEPDASKHDAFKHDASRPEQAATPVLEKAEKLAKHAGEQVSLTTGIAIGAAVAGAIAALAAIPYFLARGNEHKTKPEKKAKPHKVS